MRYAKIDQTGEIIFFRDMPIEDLQHYPNETLVEVGGEVTQENNYFSGETLKEKPSQPSEMHEWDIVNKKWIENIEQAWVTVRRKRDLLLLETDWMALPDAPFSTEEVIAIKIYRQALRDITEQVDPYNISWPIKP